MVSSMRHIVYGWRGGVMKWDFFRFGVKAVSEIVVVRLAHVMSGGQAIVCRGGF